MNIHPVETAEEAFKWIFADEVDFTEEKPAEKISKPKAKKKSVKLEKKNPKVKKPVKAEEKISEVEKPAEEKISDAEKILEKKIDDIASTTLTAEELEFLNQKN